MYYFTSRCGEYTIYMGKDQYENDNMIAYGLPEDVWFHVDDLSSAHVYLRQKKGQTMDDISEDLLLDCASLVKANSIKGCKMASAQIVYTRWKNLHKTSNVPGQVGFHRPQNKQFMTVEKNNHIVKALNKTKTEILNPDLRGQQLAREKETIRDQKLLKQQKAAEERAKEKQRQQKRWEAKQKEAERERDIAETIQKTQAMNLLGSDDEDNDDSSSSSEGEDFGF